MNERRFAALLVTLLLCFPVVSTAATIVLKTGQTIEGTIIERTDKYVKIDFQGAPLTYYFDEITTISGEPPNPTQPPAVPPASAQQSPSQAVNEYTDKETGLTITAPNGWTEFALPGSPDTSNMGWRKSDNTDVPYVLFQAKAALAGVNTTKDFAKDLLVRYRQSGSITVIEEPREVVLNGVKLFKMVTDMSKSGSPVVIRSATYVYVAEGRAIRIFIADDSTHFAETESETATVLDSIKIRTP